MYTHTHTHTHTHTQRERERERDTGTKTLLGIRTERFSKNDPQALHGQRPWGSGDGEEVDA
jgi:hypothetical protein